MIIQEKLIKVGEYDIVLKSPKKEEAATLLKYLLNVLGQSKFLSMDPEEAKFTLEDEEQFILSHENCDKGFLMGAYHKEKLVALVGIAKNNQLKRQAHRVQLAISVDKEYQNIGIGRKLLENALLQCKENAISIIELSVYEENKRAIHLYESIGFERIGLLKKAYKLDENIYSNEVFMAYYL